MSDLFKFIVNGDSISMFKVEDGGTEPVRLHDNQTLSLDPVTNDVTLTSTFADHIAIGVFHQTPDTTDDPSLYLGGDLTFTKPDGTPILPGPGAHGGPGGDAPGSVADDQDLDGNPNDVIKAGNHGGDHHGLRQSALPATQPDPLKLRPSAPCRCASAGGAARAGLASVGPASTHVRFVRAA